MPKASILCESDLHADWFASGLLQAGFSVQRCTLDQVPDRLATGAFSVLILGRLYVLHRTRQQEERLVQDVQLAMDAFLKQGGGVLITMSSGGTIPLNPILSPYAVSIEPVAIDVPPEHRLTLDSDGWRVRHGRSSNVIGLDGQNVGDVWFPAEMGSSLVTRPLQIDRRRGWRSVLSAPPGSRVHRLVEGQGNGALVSDEPVQEHVDDVLPILAALDVAGGAGRLAVCGIAGGFHLAAPHTFQLARQFLRDGFEGHPSGLARLLVDTLRWLSEPAVARGLGGASSDDDLLVPHVPRFGEDPPVRWPERDFPPVDRPRRGLIGARTSLSSGSGNPAEYVAAAKRRGLDFIVFLEAFSSLTPESFATLKAQCERLSDDAFLAVPGYTIDDVAGNHSFQFGYQIQLPRPDLLSADGKILMNRGNDGTSRNKYVDNLHGSLLFGEFQTRCRRGFYHHRDSRIRLSDHRFVDSLGVVTWEHGRVIDDIRPRHRELADFGMRMNPTIITLLNAPADVDAALDQGWHNQVLEPYSHIQDRVQRRHMAPELEWWGFIDETVCASPRYRFDCWQYGLPFQCASTGPIIEAFTVSASDRDPQWRGPDCEIPPTADWFRVDVATFRLRLRVSSEVGLREVRLLDGKSVIRRWNVAGHQTFDQELDLTHHQQMHLLLEAQDMQGGWAISSEYATFRRDWCEFICADRNNPLQIGYERDDQGLAFGWSGTLYLTYNNGLWGGTSLIHGRWWYYGDKMYPVPMDPRHDPIQPTDGGVGFSAGGLHLMPDLSRLDPPELVLMLQPRQEMISTDVAICGFAVEHGADPGWPGFFGQERTGWSLFPTEPTRYLELHRRAIVFRPRPQALTTTLYEHHFKLKRAIQGVTSLVVGWLDSYPRHVMETRGGQRIEIEHYLSEHDTLNWSTGDAVIAWTDGTRPAIFVNDGPNLTLARDEQNRIVLHLAANLLPRPGEQQALRFIGIGGTVHHRERSVWSEVSTAMGLRGKPAYESSVNQGTIRSSELFLDLESQGGGVLLDIPRVDLPMPIPVRVHGLNTNVPAVLYDKLTQRWRPLGMLDGIAYATLDTQAADLSLYIGHPAIADDPRIILSFAQISAEEVVLEAHNPTCQKVMTVVRTASPLGLLTVLEWPITLPPGSSALRRVALMSGARAGYELASTAGPPR